jgi:glycosyltransferase involved in cell wall biosynthesis
VFPGEEDFGLVPVESMACGRPVIAYRSGGALDTVREYESGLFFRQQTPEALSAAIIEFENIERRFDPVVIRRHAETFSEQRFREAFNLIVDREMEGRRGIKRSRLIRDRIRDMPVTERRTEAAARL